MIIIYTILIVSFLVVFVMTYCKMVELTTGKKILRISTPRRDDMLKYTWNSFVYQVTHVSWKSVKRNSYKTIVAVENFFLRLIMRLGKKFSSIGDIVRGKDIPRNRGSVSFFLKNIEEHQKSRRV